MIKKCIYIVLLGIAISCSPKTIDISNNTAIQKQQIGVDTIIGFSRTENPTFHYFANGHLSKENYPFKTIEVNGKKAGEIVRASDAKLYSGQYHILNQAIRISDGKMFSIDVHMDHIGTFTFKLEESIDGGPTTAITVKNTKINEWETLYFDFKDDIFGGPTYPKIAIFTDLYLPITGKDMHNYFTNVIQLVTNSNKPIVGDKESAVKIVVLGSSTAAGTGPSVTRNSWVNRYRRQIQAENGYSQVINLAVGGYTTYHLLPSDTHVPEDRPQPNPKQNVTMALALNPDAVIINLPSNDAARGYSLLEQLDNYRTMIKALNDHNIPVWVSTPQGRDLDKEKIQIQKDLLDSTYVMFGRNTLDFWTGLTDYSGKAPKKYDCGDGVHLNDEGHILLFEEVLRKKIVTKILDKREQIEQNDPVCFSSKFREGHALVWEENFEGNQLNEDVWSHELENGCPKLCGWGNAEKVWYRSGNTQVKEGKLVITAKPDLEKIGYWSSSRLVTRDKYNFQFGRIDIRAKLPETRGLWPALWLLGANIQTDGWPYCGEIDMMEEKGQIPWRVRGTLHYNNADGAHNYKGGKKELLYGNYSDDFHLFSIDWNKDRIQFFVDDEMYKELKYSDLDLDEEKNPFLNPFYMVINLAVGGNYLGYPDDSSVFPQTLELDYIRYYKVDKFYYCPKTEDKVMQMPPKDKLWIFLLAGQSNMEGAGSVAPQDTLTNPRILTMNKEREWIYAKEPIHFHTNGNRGLDMGMSFAATLLSAVPDDVSIAIIPSAMGGSGIDQWLSDEPFREQQLWSNLKTKIHAVEANGEFKGVLWHQGETDATPEKIPKYDERLHSLLERIRNEVDVSSLPLVVGELGAFNTNRPLWIQFNKGLQQIAEEDSLIGVVGTSDLSDIGDQVHFNAEGQRTMGIRYAREMSKLLKLPIPVTLNNYKMMTYNIRLDVVADGDNAWAYRKKSLVDQIREMAPDIVGIQEALPNQVDYIQNNLTQYDLIGKARDGESNRDEYSALLYNIDKYKLLSSNTIWLSDSPSKVSKGWDAACLRVCTYGHFEDKKSNTKFWVFNTHLDHEGSLARTKGMHLILNKIKSLSDNEAVVLMGDFNVLPDDPLITIIKKEYKDGFSTVHTSNNEVNGTFNGFDEKSKCTDRIDYIFANNMVKFEKYRVDRSKVNGEYISDHFPVIVEMKF